MPLISLPKLDPVPPPAPAVGATQSTPLNYALGAAAGVGSNALMANYGPDITADSFITNGIVQFVKQFDFVDQHRWGVLLAIVVGIVVMFVLLLLSEGNTRQAVERGGLAGWQALMNFHTLHVAGINILPGVVDKE